MLYPVFMSGVGRFHLPTYDYKCTVCQVIFEMRQGFDASPVQSCTQCGSPSKRRFHAVGVIYKGTGFYTTDYKRKETDIPVTSEDGAKAKPEEKQEVAKNSDTAATKNSDTATTKNSSNEASKTSAKSE